MSCCLQPHSLRKSSASSFPGASAHPSFLPQRKVLEQFQAMRDSSWRVIDASQAIDDIQQQLREQAAAVVARCQRGGEPIKQLWGGGEGSGAPLAEIANMQ